MFQFPLIHVIFMAFALFCRIQSIGGIPMQMTVQKGSQECLYDTLKEGEKVTMSAFILSGTSLQGLATLEGPIAPIDIENPTVLLKRDMLPKGKDLISVKEKLDFEHFNIDYDDDDDDSSDDDDETEEYIDPNDPEAHEKRQELKRKQREKYINVKKKRERKRLERQQQIRKDGEPFLYTQEAPQAGWYRVCMRATVSPITVEIEMRKESELGGLDESGHVITYESKYTLEEDLELEKDTASQEGIKDEDFQQTRDKVKELRRLLNEIQSMQQKERRRLTVHAETNEHSHSRMVLSSLMETLLFMGITGYQIYTIRRWFSGAPVLGR